VAGTHQAGEVSNEIMHITDSITTIEHAAGLTEPTDRIIDGVKPTRLAHR